MAEDAVFIGPCFVTNFPSCFASPLVFALKVFCLIIHFQDQRQCGGAVEVLILHHVLPKVSPSGRRQHYFSTGRHLAAAAGTNSGTRDAIRLGGNPTGCSLIIGFQFHIQFLLSFLEISMLLEPIPKTYENSGNSFHTFIIS